MAVIATDGIDGIWMNNVDISRIKEIENDVGIIGSVNITDCIKVKPEKIKEKILNFAGKNYWKYYPKYLIPDNTVTGNIFIWKLENAKKWYIK